MSEAIIARGGRGSAGSGSGSDGNISEYEFTTEIITTNTIWPVPTGVYKNQFDVRIFGGGGGGNTWAGGGSGWMNNDTLELVPNSSIVINIGARGTSGGTGGTTIFGEYLSANGGSGATVHIGGSGGAGGYGLVTGGIGYQFGGGGGGVIGGDGGPWGGGGGCGNQSWSQTVVWSNSWSSVYDEYQDSAIDITTSVVNTKNLSALNTIGNASILLAAYKNGVKAGISETCGNGGIGSLSGNSGINTVNIVSSDMAGLGNGGNGSSRLLNLYTGPVSGVQTYNNYWLNGGGGGGGYGGFGGNSTNINIMLSETKYVNDSEYPGYPNFDNKRIIAKYFYPIIGGGGGGYAGNGVLGGGGYSGDGDKGGGGGYGNGTVNYAHGGTNGGAGTNGICVIQYYKK